MNTAISVAGATGNLGERICRELIKRNATVRAIVRPSSDVKRVEALETMGVQVIRAELADTPKVVEACKGASCVVSILAGLHEVIVDDQLQLLNAAVEAGVPRFIPSDFSTDFTHIPEGENRNFDLRKEFRKHLDSSNIKATSIFNGAFADILLYNTPMFNVPQKTVCTYDGKADWKMDFTTMDDTAAFTAEAALDNQTPRALHIASFSVSPNDLVELSEKQKGERFTLVNMGSMEGFSAYNKKQRAADPEGENKLYPQWQQAQYVYSMFLVPHASLDNSRYPGLSWSPVEETIR